jgi:O-antigen ligase
MSLFIVAVLFVIGAILPARLVLPIVPALIVLLNAGVLGPVAVFGSVQLVAQDPLLIAAACRVVASALHHPEEPFGRATLALVLFFLALAPGLFTGWRVFGTTYATDRVVSLARFALEALAIPALALSIRDPRDARFVERALYVVAYVAAATIYLDVILLPYGIRLGELQGEYSGSLRSFGIAGDQVGFFLALFFLHSVLRRRPIPATFFLVAIVLTVGLGAMLTVGTGLAVIGLIAARRQVQGRAKRRIGARAVAGAVIALAVAAYLGAGLVRERLSGGDVFGSGSGLQRALTAAVAVDIVKQHPIGGIGFLGLMPASLQYGSIAILRAGWEGDELPAGFVANAGNQYLESLVDGGVVALVGLLAMLVTFARLLRQSARRAPADVRPFLIAGFVWLVAMMIGNQTAVWLLPGSLLAFSVYLLVGAAQGLEYANRRAALAGGAQPSPAGDGAAPDPTESDTPEGGDA